MASMIRHMSMNISGCLRNFRIQRKSLKGLFTDENERELSHLEAKQYLNECLAKGWKVIPMGDGCEGFDYQTGCPGHLKE